MAISLNRLSLDIWALSDSNRWYDTSFRVCTFSFWSDHGCKVANKEWTAIANAWVASSMRPSITPSLAKLGRRNRVNPALVDIFRANLIIFDVLRIDRHSYIAEWNLWAFWAPAIYKPAPVEDLRLPTVAWLYDIKEFSHTELSISHLIEVTAEVCLVVFEEVTEKYAIVERNVGA